MAKKSFVQSAHDSLIDTVPAEKLRQDRNNNKTQGKTGEKHIRINMAIYPDNYDYIKSLQTYGTFTGNDRTMTAIINNIIAEHREQNNNKDVLAQIQELQKQLK